MKNLTLLLVFAVASQLHGGQSHTKYFNKIVDAIYIAEGGSKTKHPYGILSVKVKNAKEARKVCFNTVRNNHRRWIKAGRPGDFIDFLQKRYCPVGAENDPSGLNIHWQKNVRFYLRQNI